MTRARHTVLVVDDEPDVVKSIQDLLRFDYKVLGATRAAEGMRLLREQPVHVVLTDQRMPEMTGVEFLRRLREEFPDAVRLLVTGYADIRAVIDAINQGSVYRYITKPWEPEELQAIIREAAERHDLVTERKRLMEELKAKNEQLQRTNDELRAANELKAAFIQVASHELRTPLTILMGLTRLAGTAAAQQESGAPIRPFLDRIEHAARRMQHLVDQLVTMLQAGRFERPLERKPVDVAALLHEAADDVRPFVELRKQTLNVEAAGELGVAELEAGKIRDSLNHLLLNAIKFTPDGGTITLAAQRTAGADGDGSAGAGDVIQVRVTDTGSGIDPACQVRIFEPFFTGYDVSRHSSGQYEHGRRGLGLGLSVVKAFVEMHGGAVRCDTEIGRGTTFTITLPVKPPAEQQTSSPPSPAAAPA